MLIRREMLAALSIKLFAAGAVKAKHCLTMVTTSVFQRFFLWLTSPAIFGSVKKRFPGKWMLFEYYVDGANELLHVEEAELKEKDEIFRLDIIDDVHFVAEVKMALPLLKNLKKGKWELSRNFIILADPGEFRNNIEFQFAFEKETLKLLKKDVAGKIEFFGFFKPEESKK